MWRCRGVEVQRCSDVEVQRCRGAEVQSQGRVDMKTCSRLSNHGLCTATHPKPDRVTLGFGSVLKC